MQQQTQLHEQKILSQHPLKNSIGSLAIQQKSPNGQIKITVKCMYYLHSIKLYVRWLSLSWFTIDTTPFKQRTVK